MHRPGPVHFTARSDHDFSLRTRALCGLGACASEDPGGTMTLLEDVDALKTRLARVLSERDAWRAAGLQEKYLEAYSMVEALELQLERRLRQPKS